MCCDVHTHDAIGVPIDLQKRRIREDSQVSRVQLHSQGDAMESDRIEEHFRDLTP
jgi:hypothetical protein